MLPEKKTIQMFEETGVLLEGHFSLTSGLHSAKYLQCAKIFQYPEYAAELCHELAARFATEKIDLCIGPALGGIIIAYETARSLGVRGMFAERDADGKMALRRGFEIRKDERVLVLEDVITTGSSVQEVISLVHELGGHTAGIGTLVNRSGNAAIFNFPFASLIAIKVETYSPQDCPLCRQSIPVVKPGSRK
ncbi:MAG TPA: orotate phosphoribosyltransferase [Candidatus Limnocylindrales bacterium]|nr:orotate phosphoribosyltransferase [Candidatus Limnocylindrales bacterium]